MTKKQKKNLIRIIITLVCFITLFIICESIKIENWFSLILYLAIYLLIAYDVVIASVRNIFNKEIFDENLLMLIATVGAFVISSYEEAVAVMLFYQVGEFFQSYAVGKSRKSISKLMDIRPDYANLKTIEGVLKVDPDEVKIDDVIVVYPGEKVPLDGVVIDGNSTFDTKALTGESLPSDLGVDDSVISGSVNLTTTVEIKVSKEFYDSTVNKILDLVENASSQKSKAENFITKFARFYTPIVVISALLLALIPGLITKEYKEWIYRALNFLVVSCPCALVISIPLSFFCGIVAASKAGILVKGSKYLEKLNEANIFVFDKTGTLTKGNFEVTDVYPKDKKEEILKLAATAEYGSNHPIAKSILKHSSPNLGYTLTNVSGCGVIAQKDNEVIHCGNEKLMNLHNIFYKKNSNVGTILYVSKNHEFVGSIVISDEIKPEAVEVLKDLDSYKTIMLTGDNENTASKYAEILGIKEFEASLLPQDKVLSVSNLLENKKEKDVLCYIGDGINDAPALMRSDIGISMGQVGSDAAIEASDIVLMKDDLKGIINARKIAKKTMTIVRQNIVFAIGIKLLVLALSAFGIANMWLSIFADVGVAFLAILNAIRANKIKTV